jgi:hypothetical protein
MTIVLAVLVLGTPIIMIGILMLGTRWAERPQVLAKIDELI